MREAPNDDHIITFNFGRAQMTFPARISMSKGSPVAA
ncbi:hypothetical protein CGRA01v4_08631 [Colletotrichum graminicola]|nr:hypothetical protein CGRA01v4_08631 [Colletotrichum graminicola]